LKKKSQTPIWTEGRLKSFITSTLRGGFRRYPPKYEVLKEAMWGKKLNSKTGRQAIHYTCASCKHEYPAREIQIDHIEAVVIPEEGFVSWDKFISRLFCSKENLQALCVTCHKKKTKEETERRKK
jgi:ribosomal protein L44E